MNHPTDKIKVHDAETGKETFVDIDKKLSEVICDLDSFGCYTTGCCQGDDQTPGWIILSNFLGYRQIAQALVIVQDSFCDALVLMDTNIQDVSEGVFLPRIVINIFWDQNQAKRYFAERESGYEAGKKYENIRSYFAFCKGVLCRTDKIANKISSSYSKKSNVVYSPVHEKERIEVNIWDDYKRYPDYEKTEPTRVYIEDFELNLEDQYNIIKMVYGAILMVIYSEPRVFQGCGAKIKKRDTDYKPNFPSSQFQEVWEIEISNFDENKFNELKKRMLDKSIVDLEYMGKEILIGSGS